VIRLLRVGNMGQIISFTGFSSIIAFFELFLIIVILHERKPHTKRLVYVLCALFVFTLGSTFISLSLSHTLTAIARHLRFFSLLAIPFLLYGYFQQFTELIKKWNLMVPGILLGFSTALLIVALVAHYHLDAVFLTGETEITLPVFNKYPSVFHCFAAGLQVMSILISLYLISKVVYHKTIEKRKRVLLVLCGFILFSITLLGMTLFMAEPFQRSLLLIILVFSTGLVLLLYASESQGKTHSKHSSMMFETLQDGIVILGTYQRILDISPKAKEYMPDLTDSFLGRTLAEASEHVQLLKVYAKQYSRVDATAQGLIITMPQKAGASCFYEIRQFSAVKTPFSLLIIRDMSECCRMRKSVQESLEQLSQVNQLKSMLIEIMAHDLRSPLVSMKSMQQLMSTNAVFKDDPMWNQMNTELDVLIDRANSLLTNLLALSILSDAKQRYPITALDVQMLLDTGVKSVQRHAAQKSIQLVIKIEDNVLISVNEFLAGVALRNILENAIKYSPKYEVVHLNVSIQPETVQITVKNGGVPIGLEALKAFSEGRWGVHTSGTAGEKGPGLGLFATKKFLEYVGGEVVLEPCHPNGTRAVLHMKRAFPN